MAYVIYNPSGKIIKQVSCPDDMIVLQLSTDESYIEGKANDELEYILNDKVESKKTMGLILTGGPEFVLSNLPVPSTVSIDGQVFSVPDGILEFTIDQVGTYDIVCEAVNYLTKKFTVTV